ncbi:MAG TPA: hypothetical protein GXX51_02215 [Firmicutes bacterium]|nr:hypothetical protein [Bacillota bacterium]
MSTGNQVSVILQKLGSISTDIMRVYHTRPTSNNHASGMVALFSGLLTFRCVVINDRAVLGRDVYVFFERRNVTREFAKMVARRIAGGSDGAPQGELPFTPVLSSGLIKLEMAFSGLTTVGIARRIYQTYLRTFDRILIFDITGCRSQLLGRLWAIAAAL